MKLLLLILLSLANQTFGLGGIHTEGGSYNVPAEEPQPEYYEPPVDYSSILKQQQQELEDAELADILNELGERQRFREQRMVDQPLAREQPLSRAEQTETEARKEEEQLRAFSEHLKQLAQQNQEQPEEQLQEDAQSAGPLVAQKKGQSEFVGFVEPIPANAFKNLETLEKRVSADQAYEHRQNSKAFLGLISSSGNILFIAFVTMCCVLSVVGVVGGMYYYNHVHIHREDMFDDFTRYSPAGPGRDKLKRFGDQTGDDSLAYKAQLHHYQQTKQKIIGSDERHAGAEMDMSDKSDDEADLEHNFSVYECPGLAPTGDLEVQNPNFVDANSKHHQRQ